MVQDAANHNAPAGLVDAVDAVDLKADVLAFPIECAPGSRSNHDGHPAFAVGNEPIVHRERNGEAFLVYAEAAHLVGRQKSYAFVEGNDAKIRRVRHLLFGLGAKDDYGAMGVVNDLPGGRPKEESEESAVPTSTDNDKVSVLTF